MAKFCEGCGHPLEDNAQFCDKCGRKTGGKCLNCGAPMAPGERFCPKCGAKAGAAAALPHQPISAPPPVSAQAAPRPPVPPQNRPAAPAYAPAPKKKSMAGLFIALGAGGLVLIVLAIVLVSVLANPKFELIPFPDSLKVDDEVKVSCQYTFADKVIPANYRSLDDIVFMTCYTDTGKTKLMVSVEIPGFTQKYEQLIDVSRAETELSIHPPLLADISKSLNSSKDAQLIVSVKDQNTGKVIIQDTKSVKLYSRNDIQWAAQDGTPYDENILAWVTPEAAEIDSMLRDTADALNYLSGGKYNSIVGYQQMGDLSQADITLWQTASMMYTLAQTYQVKYIMAPFSATGSELQSVKTPSQVIQDKAGLCVETAVTMASAIQRTNMHAVIILLPGHAQVAVETWSNSGEYWLIETTALDSTRSQDFGSVFLYKTKDEWAQYMAQEGYLAIDCDLAEKLHIQAID